MDPIEKNHYSDSEMGKVLLVIFAMSINEQFAEGKEKFMTPERIREVILERKGRDISIGFIRSVFDMDTTFGIGLFFAHHLERKDDTILYGAYRLGFCNDDGAVPQLPSNLQFDKK
jgi:hypothetical protein